MYFKLQIDPKAHRSYSHQWTLAEVQSGEWIHHLLLPCTKPKTAGCVRRLTPFLNLADGKVQKRSVFSLSVGRRVSEEINSGVKGTFKTSLSVPFILLLNTGHLFVSLKSGAFIDYSNEHKEVGSLWDTDVTVYRGVKVDDVSN